MTEEQRLWRSGLSREAKTQSLAEARDMLAGEQAAYNYLVETNRDGAARIVERNIQRMTHRVKTVEQDLNG